MALSDGLGLWARAAKMARGQQIETRRYWATVVSGGTVPTVEMDADPSRTPRPVSANAVGAVTTGQRVQVELRNHRLTIVARPV